MKKVLYSGGKLFFLTSIILAFPEIYADPKWQTVTEGLAYDKNSIVYPRDKKLLGMTVKDKDIVRVWVRSAFGERQFEFNCRKRLVELPEGLGMDVNGNFQTYFQTCQESYAQHGIELTPKEIEIICRTGRQTEEIRPGSKMEKLMENVCK